MERNNQPPQRLGVVFISGPYTAVDRAGVQRNIDAARRLAIRLVKAGVYFVCPHTNSQHMDDIGGYAYWCDMYVAILKRCDALITFGNWRKSNGARLEVTEASLAGIPTFHNYNEFINWWRFNGNGRQSG